MIYFITGSKHKFEEVSLAMSGQLEQLDIDLPEIQEIDSRIIIEAKLKEAFKHHAGPFIVEDTSLYLECLNGLPGPLIKWFMKTIGNKGLYQIAAGYGNFAATARTVIGYAKDAETIEFFEGEISGTIKEHEIESDFGWDPIFVPHGFSISFAEMAREAKNEISMRGKAALKLKEYIS